MPDLLTWLESDPVHERGTPRLLIPPAVAAARPGSREYLNDRSIFRPLDAVPLPRWDLIEVADYPSMVQTTGGCPFRCEFCHIIQFNGGFSRAKAPETVRRELEAILATGDRGGIFTVDDNFVGLAAATSAILDAIIGFQREHDYPFTFYAQASVNLGAPELRHLVLRMKEAGFNAVFLGIENPDERALLEMNKKQNLKVDLREAVEAIQAEGIEVYAGFIFRSDADEPSTVDRIVEFVKRTRIFTAMTGVLTPIPFTPLWERLNREGRLQSAEYSGNNTHNEVQLIPARMTLEDVHQGMREILTRLFNPSESYRCALDMLRAVQPHIFVRRRFQPRYLWSALASSWKLRIRRLDPAYLRLLWGAWTLDLQRYREVRREAKRIKRLARDLRCGSAARGIMDPGWI